MKVAAVRFCLLSDDEGSRPVREMSQNLIFTEILITKKQKSEICVNFERDVDATWSQSMRFILLEII